MLDDELGLNWHTFKYRNYDASLARFHNIDPLAEKYVYNGTYNFAENKVIQYNELEGLEAGMPAFYGELSKRLSLLFSGGEKIKKGVRNTLDAGKSGNSGEMIASYTDNPIEKERIIQEHKDNTTGMIIEGGSEIDSAIPDASTPREAADGLEITGDILVLSSFAGGNRSSFVKYRTWYKRCFGYK